MSENIQLTYAQKKYLFAIYKLGQNGGVVKSSNVAKLVGVTKASTAIMTETKEEYDQWRYRYPLVEAERTHKRLSEKRKAPK